MLVTLAALDSLATLATERRGQPPKRVGKDYKPGDAFGELALLGGPTATRKAGIVAEEASICKRTNQRATHTTAAAY